MVNELCTAIVVHSFFACRESVTVYVVSIYIIIKIKNPAGSCWILVLNLFDYMLSYHFALSASKSWNNSSLALAA